MSFPSILLVNEVSGDIENSEEFSRLLPTSPSPYINLNPPPILNFLENKYEKEGLPSIVINLYFLAVAAWNGCSTFLSAQMGMLLKNRIENHDNLLMQYEVGVRRTVQVQMIHTEVETYCRYSLLAKGKVLSNFLPFSKNLNGSSY